MKVKSPAQTCGKLGKAHAYLGHFRKAKHLNRGHNDVNDTARPIVFNPLAGLSEIGAAERSKDGGLIKNLQEDDKKTPTNVEYIEKD